MLIQSIRRAGLAGCFPFQIRDPLECVLTQGAIGIAHQKLLKHSQVAALSNTCPLSQFGDTLVRRRGFSGSGQRARLQFRVRASRRLPGRRLIPHSRGGGRLGLPSHRALDAWRVLGRARRGCRGRYRQRLILLCALHLAARGCLRWRRGWGFSDPARRDRLDRWSRL